MRSATVSRKMPSRMLPASWSVSGSDSLSRLTERAAGSSLEARRSPAGARFKPAAARGRSRTAMTRTPVRLPIRIKVPRPIRCPSTTISTVRSCSGSNGNRKFGASCFTWLAGSSKRPISNRTCSDRLSVSASASHAPAMASVGMLHAQDEVAPGIGCVARRWPSGASVTGATSRSPMTAITASPGSQEASTSTTSSGDRRSISAAARLAAATRRHTGIGRSRTE